MSVVIIGGPGPIAEAANSRGLHVEFLALRRGREVLHQPRRLAGVLTRTAPDVVVTPSSGYLPATIRLGGYRGRIVAVEHGSVLQLRNLGWAARAIQSAAQGCGLWAVNDHVAPSEFARTALMRKYRVKRVVRIYPGLEFGGTGTTLQCGYGPSRRASEVVIGFAGRLIPGKGGEWLLRALARLNSAGTWKLRIAGEGAHRARLQELTRTLALDRRVEFVGWVQEMPSFWAGCDLAVVPSLDWTESFGMVALEAMAAGVPVISARNGGLPEVVIHEETGLLVPPGSDDALVTALRTYVDDAALRLQHGKNAWQRARKEFDIRRCAAEFDSVMRGRPAVILAPENRRPTCG